MVNKFNYKLLFVPAGFLIIIALIILSVPMGNKKKTEQTISPSPFPTGKISTSPISKVPTSGPSPTLIPLKFTGGDLTQDIPPDVKLFSKQKTELRRKSPLELPFGTISFDYETDQFTITSVEPKDQNLLLFQEWLKQNYSAIPSDGFIKK